MLKCPSCGAVESHPFYKDKIVIRAYKIFDSSGAWSQCLRCSGGYSSDLKTFDPNRHDPEKGWFCT